MKPEYNDLIQFEINGNSYNGRALAIYSNSLDVELYNPVTLVNGEHYPVGSTLVVYKAEITNVEKNTGDEVFKWRVDNIKTHPLNK